MSNFLIELSVIHAAFILGYQLFLRKERQYSKMRFYLIASTLLAIVIPLLRLPKIFPTSQPMNGIPMESISLDAIAMATADDMSSWRYEAFFWTYITISGFFFIRFASGLLYLVWLGHRSTRLKIHDVWLRKVKNIKGSFTFFNWIFLSDDIDPHQHDYEVILKHEKAHVTLGHTYDVLFFELFRVCFWWLPTAWIIIKEIKKIHEYQADAVALKSCDVDQYSSILISSTLKTNGLRLASSFHDGLILKRLKAMKQKAKKVSPWKFAALSVLCALLVVVFACSEDKSDASLSGSPAQGEIFTIVEAQPEFEGGIQGFRNYIANEIKYPLQARQAGIQGSVDVQFVVEKDGSLSDVEAVKGIGAGCDEEAVRVVQNAPPFKPGSQNGKPVRVRMAVPITFKLSEDKTNPDKSRQGIVIIEDVQSRNEQFKVDVDYMNGEWTGTVYDEDGNGLPGVNILVVGTTKGTVSGPDGTFRLKAEKSQDLALSFIGYESRRIEGF